MTKSNNKKSTIFKRSYFWMCLVTICMSINLKFFPINASICIISLSIHSSVTSILLSTHSNNYKFIIIENSYVWMSLIIRSMSVNFKFTPYLDSISSINLSEYVMFIIPSYYETAIWEYSYNREASAIRAFAFITINFKFSAFFLSVCLIFLSKYIIVAAILVTYPYNYITSVKENSNTWIHPIFSCLSVYLKFWPDFNKLRVCGWNGLGLNDYDFDDRVRDSEDLKGQINLIFVDLETRSIKNGIFKAV